VQAHITGTGAAVAVAVKSGHGLATAAGEGGSEDVGAHGVWVDSTGSRMLGWVRLRLPIEATFSTPGRQVQLGTFLADPPSCHGCFG
jgi:hypothetical protein